MVIHPFTTLQAKEHIPMSLSHQPVLNNFTMQKIQSFIEAKRTQLLVGIAYILKQMVAALLHYGARKAQKPLMWTKALLMTAGLWQHCRLMRRLARSKETF